MICGVELSDSGEYTCVVESGYTSDQHTMQLTVNDYKGQSGRVLMYVLVECMQLLFM